MQPELIAVAMQSVGKLISDNVAAKAKELGITNEEAAEQDPEIRGQLSTFNLISRRLMPLCIAEMADKQG